MSRVQADHVFLLASKPEHPLSPAALDGWTVERTELRHTSWEQVEPGVYIDHMTFVHYVSPPAARSDNRCGPCQRDAHFLCKDHRICPCAKADHERTFEQAMCPDEESSQKG